MKLSILSAASGLVLSIALSAAAETPAIENDRGHVFKPGPDMLDAMANSAITVPEPSEFNLDDYVGYTYAGKPILDLNGVVGQIDSGARDPLNAQMITYTFLEMDHLTGLFNNPTLGFTAGLGVGPLSEAQRAEARQSVQFWDDLVPHQFVEKNGQGADIRFANSADPAQAYAYYPSDSVGYRFLSDVFLADPALNWTNNWLGFNGYGATTIIHELGHSQGMLHPGNYDYDPSLPLNYANYAEYAQDSEQYTIMSYWDPDETGAYIVDWGTGFFGNAQTPLLHDIYVVQSMYGADPNTRSGDTVYGFNSNADRDVFDFSQNHFPNVAIYDAGGNDTIDLSGFDAGVFVNLHAGSFSSAAQAFLPVAEVNARRAALAALSGLSIGPVSQAALDNAEANTMATLAYWLSLDTGVPGVGATSYDNIAIAYGVVIENAKGGSQRDLLWGNQANNVLTGNGGDDVLDGFEGADTYVGGAGYDTFLFTILETGDEIEDFTTAEDTIVIAAPGVSFAYIGAAAFSNTPGELRYDGGVLMGDADGDGAADIEIDLHNAALSASDLSL